MLKNKKFKRNANATKFMKELDRQVSILASRSFLLQFL